MQPKLVGQEIELRVKRPLAHVLVEIIQVRIGGVGLVHRLKTVLAVEKLHHRGLSSPHVSRNRNELLQSSVLPSLPWTSRTRRLLRPEAGDVYP